MAGTALKLLRFSFLFDDAGGENHAVAVVMQLQREDQYVPVPAVSLGGQVGQSAEAAVYISLASIGHGADDVPPFSAQFREFLKQFFAGEPGALFFI